MFREAVHTRCGHGIDIVTGRRFDIDGYKVHDIDGTLLTDDKIDKRLLSDQLLTRIPGKPDGYSYFVPDLGESSLVGYHSVDSGADRQGNFVSQAYVGDFTDVYPFTTFGDEATWDAKQTSESDYYKRIPTFGTYTKSTIGSRRFEMSDVAEFISHGNRNLLLRRLISFIIDEFKKPIGKRRSVIIRDVSEHDIEMWVKAAELAFSPRIAASISFTTRIESLRSNFYTVDDRMRHDGIDLTRGDEFQRSMYMLVGIIDDEDGAPIIEIGHNQRYVMLDGKTMTFDGCEHETPSLLRYLDIVTSYTLSHRTFVTEFLQMLDITQKSLADLRLIRHDIRNRYSYISLLLDNGQYAELKEYLQDMKEEIAPTLSVIDCGNKTLTNILNMEKAKAESRGVRMETDLNVPPILPFRDTALCSVFSNLIDNAIEASMLCAEDGAEIRVRVSILQEYLYIGVMNRLPAGRSEEEALALKTTKQNASNHGFGTKIVRKIAEQYNGYVTYSVENGRFIAEVMLDMMFAVTKEKGGNDHVSLRGV